MSNAPIEKLKTDRIYNILKNDAWFAGLSMDRQGEIAAELAADHKLMDCHMNHKNYFLTLAKRKENER